MTAASNSPSDVAFDKMMTAAIETCDALTDFYSHMEDVRRNALAGTPLPEMDAIKITGAVHEAHDRYFAAACEYEDIPCECAECRAKEATTNETAAPASAPPETKLAANIARRFH